MAKMKIDVALTQCSECEKYNIGIQIFKAFAWGPQRGFLLRLMSYDKQSDTILINEKALMRLIRLVNPGQEDRAIRLISEQEMVSLTSGNKCMDKPRINKWFANDSN